MDHKHHTTEHKSHGSTELTTGGSPGMSHGSAEGFLKRFWLVTLLLIPLVISSAGLMGFFGLSAITLAPWMQFVFATIIFLFGLVFFQHARHELQMGKPGMMTLVSLAVGAGYLFSAVATFVPSLEVSFYLEISTLIWVLLFGHYLEAKSSSAAGDALSLVAELLPSTAHRKQGETITDVPISELKVDDMVLVKPGEKVPADGVIMEGKANVNEAHISGESKPQSKSEGNELAAGAIVLDGALTVRLTRVGEHSTVGQIKQLIAEAGKTKPRSQRLADKAAAVLTIVASVTALLTLLVWTLVIGEPFVFAITLAITVLVIACPHALGLAIPTVTTIATRLAVKNGLFIKDLSKLEVIRKADYVVFDKTGTLTTGVFGVEEAISLAGAPGDNVLKIAASLESQSSHVIGISIVEATTERGLALNRVTNFKNHAGKGISGVIDGKQYYIGKESFVQEKVKWNSSSTSGVDTTGKTAVYLAEEDRLVGVILLADHIRDEAREAVKALHGNGVQVAMITGDNESVAASVAGELKIDTYFAGVLPEDKYQYVKKLQEGGKVVIMVGDGVNDAPALTQADAGVAIGAGTDIAVESGDVVLTQSDPRSVTSLIILARKVYSKMIQNLVWALGYNIVAIPAAAGVFAAFGFILRPEIGALIMSLSTVIVVINALTLRRVKLISSES